MACMVGDHDATNAMLAAQAGPGAATVRLARDGERIGPFPL